MLTRPQRDGLRLAIDRARRERLIRARQLPTPAPAEAFLLAALRDGPRAAGDVAAEAARAGISGYALTKGRRTLGIRPRDGRWALPYDEREDITPA